MKLSDVALALRQLCLFHVGPLLVYSRIKWPKTLVSRCGTMKVLRKWQQQLYHGLHFSLAACVICQDDFIADLPDIG